MVSKDALFKQKYHKLKSPTAPRTFKKIGGIMPTQDYSAMSDAQLVTLAKKDDPDAFGELYERYVDKIHRYISHKVSDTRDAEDLTSLVFFRALRKIEQYKPPKNQSKRQKNTPFSSWLYRIATNAVKNYYRDNKKRAGQRSLEHVAQTPSRFSVHNEVIGGITEEVLVEAIRSLSEDEQLAVTLKLQGYSYQEIAVEISRTEAAAKSLIFRARRRLREKLAYPKKN